ncbi:uncharacterized protein LOC131640711 [Vicia villosa]|uniref:uncharacterized protein LOC131640711 n=1 Tax=Vicia villosa TaxID=3911 RepID=UPI00273AED29|nr:uncharacterized protein LOC131640711 [Vicia villosa]
MGTTSLSSNSPSLINIILTKRSTSLPSTRHNNFLALQPHTSLTFHSISCNSSGNNNAANTDQNETDSIQAPTTTPVELRLKRRSRRQAKRQKENGTLTNSIEQPSKAKAAPKKWEEMNLSEKALELYVGEKGALFWLNKFAYASIYIMIGAWIMFRFVGPALNIYQLDSPVLSPGDVLKG